MAARAAVLALWAALGAASCGDFVRYQPTTEDLDEPCPVRAEPPPDLVEMPRVDHGAWDSLLSSLLRADADGTTRVDYASLLSDADARSQLEDYLGLLARVDASALDDQDERLAFFINAYNASVVWSVLPAFGADPGFSTADDDFAFFSRAEHLVSGVRISLDQLEHGIIRGELSRGGVDSADPETRLRIRVLHSDLWGCGTPDARIHMALNCAALGCPNLRGEAYLGGRLQDQLDAATATFLADPGKGAGGDGISSLFRPDWFAADFAASAGSVRGFIEAHRPRGTEDVAFDRYLDYDWSLNAQ